MSNEEFQKIVVEQLSVINNELSTVRSELSTVKSELSAVRSELSAVKGQLDENTQIIKVLMHRTEELDAKFDGLLHTAATKDAIAKLATKEDLDAIAEDVSFLVRKAAEHDSAIRKLRRAE